MMLQKAQSLAQTHYENFPVTPFFLPKKWRQPVALIYAFARTADDHADEGDFTKEARLSKLASMEAQLTRPEDDFFISLSNIIRAHQLPIQLFHDLLHAFKQDVVQSRYQTADEVLNYCSYSAHPVGRLMLHLTKFYSNETAHYSDFVTASLQLINFLQDLTSDLHYRDRLYIPQAELQMYQVTITDLRAQKMSPEILQLIELQWQRAYDLLKSGEPILRYLNGRFKWMVALTISGGFEMLSRLKKRDTIYSRPILTKLDWFILGSKFIFKR